MSPHGGFFIIKASWYLNAQPAYYSTGQNLLGEVTWWVYRSEFRGAFISMSVARVQIQIHVCEAVGLLYMGLGSATSDLFPLE